MSFLPAFLSLAIPLTFVLSKFGFGDETMHVPLHASGDELLYATNVSALMGSWSTTNSNLGGFGGQDLSYALVSVDLGAPFLSAIIATLFSSNAFFGMNLLFVLSFPLTGFLTFESLRRLGSSPFLASLAGILLATVSFHSEWNTSSITISNYWLIGPSIAALLGLVTGRLRWRQSGSRSRSVIQATGLAFLALLGGYFYSYWAFGLAMTYSLLILSAVTLRVSPRQIGSALTFAAITVFGFVLASVQSIRAMQSADPEINYFDQRHFYGGLSNANSIVSYFNYPAGSLSEQLMSLVLPNFNSRMTDYFNFMTEKGFAGEGLSYQQSIPIALLIAFFVAWLGRHYSLRETYDTETSRFDSRLLGFALGFLVLFSAIGGIGSLFSMFASSALRGFGRFVIFTLFLMVFIIVLAASRLKPTSVGRIIRVGFISLLMFALLENFSNPVYTRALGDRVIDTTTVETLGSAPTAQTLPVTDVLASVDALNRRLEATLTDCTVLSLPITHYPYESPGYPTYRLLFPGLASNKLNWTAGAVGGSPSFTDLVPMRSAVDENPDQVVALARSEGYCAVVLDATAWNAMHFFKPWPDYVGHPKQEISQFLTASSSGWESFRTVYGDYFILELGSPAGWRR